MMNINPFDLLLPLAKHTLLKPRNGIGRPLASIPPPQRLTAIRGTLVFPGQKMSM